jgi:hypothetical protein
MPVNMKNALAPYEEFDIPEKDMEIAIKVIATLEAASKQNDETNNDKNNKLWADHFAQTGHYLAWVVSEWSKPDPVDKLLKETDHERANH